MLQSPVLVALFLISGYSTFVAVVRAAQARKTEHALVGAAVLAGLTTAATIWA